MSVLMPAYNCDAFITESIESILNQTFADFEFIIINDGSRDATADVIRKYVARDTRIRFIDNAFNAGIVSALNTGMNMCRGEYIVRMDADDISMPDRIAKQVAFMDANPRCGVLGSWYHIFGEYERTMTRPSRVGMIDLLSGCLIGHPTVMLRRAMFDKYNLRYAPEFQFCEDYELWSRAILHMDFCNIQEVLLRYRAHRASITYAHSRKQLDDTARVQKRIAEYLSSRTDVQEKLIKTFCA
ncbi:glycosyltransferase family 2 protein [bacterium]|nr:glycosyltransferase family 2 protein [bacterium]